MFLQPRFLGPSLRADRTSEDAEWFLLRGGIIEWIVDGFFLVHARLHGTSDADVNVPERTNQRAAFSEEEEL